MSCANGRFNHLFDETGVCRDCGVVDPEYAQLKEMAEVAAGHAIRCAQTAIRYDVPMNLDEAAKWAALATFLHGEHERRYSGHMWCAPDPVKEPA